MVTSANWAGFAEEVRGAGIVGCLYNPLRRVELRTAILAIIRSKPGTQVLPSAVEGKSRPTSECLRILLAEDNSFNQRVAILMLAKLGHSVTIVGNGRMAVEAVARQSFDLVLMDLQMPEMDGFEATAAIRLAEAGTSRHMQIVALTAHALKEDRDRCLEASMDGYVSKPIDRDKLRMAIEECLLRMR
jgi:two-component system, sensor histidine kinase and response regulator